MSYRCKWCFKDDISPEAKWCPNCGQPDPAEIVMRVKEKPLPPVKYSPDYYEVHYPPSSGRKVPWGALIFLVLVLAAVVYFWWQ